MTGSPLAGAGQPGHDQPGHDQVGHRVRLEWGPTGGAAIARGADVAVVVDVLSFTTALSVAVTRGMRVWPFPWQDARATDFARERDAVLAVGRQEALRRPDAVSLSPDSLSRAEGIPRMVLPSPNGSTISAALADGGARVVAAGLRNRRAVSSWLVPRLAGGATCALVPAGERWPDGSLRPCVEDLWGAGALLASCLEQGLDPALLSPEAQVAAASWTGVADHLPGRLRGCASGVELRAKGFGADVEAAAAVDADRVVPGLVDGAFDDVSEELAGR